MYRFLIFLENEHLDDCLDLVGLADLIGQSKDKYEVYGVGINLSRQPFDFNLDYLINIESKISEFDVPNIAGILKEVDQQFSFNCVLIGATTFGRMLAPRLAMKLETGLVADVTELKLNEDQLVMIRPAFSGQLMAGIICDEQPIMMSIRPRAFKDDFSHKRVVEQIDFDLKEEINSQIRHITTELKADSDDIRDSKLLVACGGGMGVMLDQAEVLAQKLGGKLAMSRRPVDAGIARREIQVGQSGKIVSPDLYIALGISGSVQHIDGLKHVGSILSVNVDKQAPINYLADMIVEGDGHEFVEKLLARIEDDINL